MPYNLRRRRTSVPPMAAAVSDTSAAAPDIVLEEAEEAVAPGGVAAASSVTAAASSGPHKLVQVALLAIVALTVHSSWFLWNHASTSAEEIEADPSLDRGAMIEKVWCAGWITAAFTGLGATPFVLFSEISGGWIGASNAVAAGMMFAASAGLVLEGVLEKGDPTAFVQPSMAVLFGFFAGMGFIKVSEILLEQYEEVKNLAGLAELDSLSARRVLLIMGVMTLHSFSEGVGIGVSYHSKDMGAFISTTLAVHNIPEGLALSLVLVPRGFDVVSTAVWCVVSSMPQPLMAVPAFFFVENFHPLLPFGLGFAAGAMIWVAAFDLFQEAQENLSLRSTVGVSTLAAVGMGSMQFLMHEGLIG